MARHHTRRRFLQTSVVGLGLASSLNALALTGYPSKPMRIVVGFAAGGGNDVLARIIAQKLSSSLGQAVVVENRPGAAGTIGANVVAKAEPDGHTLALASVSSLVIAASTMTSVPFDAEKDFSPIILTARQTIVLVVPSSLPVNSVQELIALARSKPKTLTYASGGNGVANDLAGGLFNQMTGVDINHIPYNGDAGGVVGLLGGQVSMMFAGLSGVAAHIQTGKLRPLAVDSPRRAQTLPDVPTFAEAGLPGFEINLWNGILAPAGTNPEIVQLLNGEINKALGMPDVAQQYVTLGFERVSPSRDQFVALIKADQGKWPPLVTRLGRKGS